MEMSASQAILNILSLLIQQIAIATVVIASIKYSFWLQDRREQRRASRKPIEDVLDRRRAAGE